MLYVYIEDRERKRIISRDRFVQIGFVAIVQAVSQRGLLKSLNTAKAGALVRSTL